MANYYMLGGDGKEYGPVTTDQLRQWMSEGRANAQTQVRTDGGNWTPLGLVQEVNQTGAAAVTPYPSWAGNSGSDGGSSGSSTETVKRLGTILAAGSGWMKFLGVILILSGVFTCLTIILIPVGWIPIWLGTILWGAANRAQVAAAGGGETDLYEAIDKIRFFFKLYGILILLIVLGELAFFTLFFGSVAAALSEARLHH